ncbi:MAG TPA: pitrilysin family protein [Thermoanaerobaculia bacterium]
MLVRRLPDGTAVWLDPMRDVRSLALSVTMAGGSAGEEPEERGATHFLEHLLFKRTRRRSGAAVARITDRLGGECDAYTTKESVSFHARVPSERAAEAVDLLLDLTAAPAFTAADVEVERGVILEEMAEAEDLAEDLLHEAFLRRLWPSHALGAPILGTRETVTGLTRTRLAARFRAIARPSATLVAVAGAFDPDRLVELLARARARRPQAASAGPALARGKPRSAPCAFHLARPELQQTHLLVGGSTIPFLHPLVPAAWIATEVLGGGVSSRLWRDVRERRGLAYSIGTGLTLHRAAGVSLVSAATQPKNLERLVATTARALRLFREEGITRAELRRAKNQFHAEAALSLESTAARRESAVRAWLYRGRPYSTEQFLADVDRVTLDDVSAAIGCLYGSSGSPHGAGRFSLGIAGPLPAGARPEAFVRHLADDVSEALAA